MDILRRISVPTGDILITSGELGKLECLSLGDYGKDINVKADFLNLSREIESVSHTKLLPLSEKWVITISTQYGCSMGCTFCDVPLVGKGVNATYNDLINQIKIGLSLHGDISHTDRLNIHYARMGEPTFNQNVILATKNLKLELSGIIGDSKIHPVVSTMMPKKNKKLKSFLFEWMEIKNLLFEGNAGLQISINSTNNKERDSMFSGNALSIEDISQICELLPSPIGRKITLNFAVCQYEIDSQRLRMLFDPNKFIVKLTPMHKTSSATANEIETAGNYTEYYPYAKHEKELKEAGFDVLVFIASEEEDMGRITCGNAILSGSYPLYSKELSQ